MKHLTFQCRIQGRILQSHINFGSSDRCYFGASLQHQTNTSHQTHWLVSRDSRAASEIAYCICRYIWFEIYLKYKCMFFIVWMSVWIKFWRTISTMLSLSYDLVWHKLHCSIVIHNCFPVASWPSRWCLFNLDILLLAYYLGWTQTAAGVISSYCTSQGNDINLISSYLLLCGTYATQINLTRLTKV